MIQEVSHSIYVHFPHLVGKTAILRQFFDETFDEEDQPTIGIDFRHKMYTLEDCTVSISGAAVLPWRNRQRVRLLTERLVVRAHPGAKLFAFLLLSRRCPLYLGA